MCAKTKVNCNLIVKEAEKMDRFRKINSINSYKLPAICLLIILSSTFSNILSGQKVKINHLPDLKKVDITIDGDYFTSYIYPDDLEKTVLYPVKAANGHYVTRGFPIKPRPNERVDHPHQVGVWLNYGEVNGLDFWNNSYAIAKDQKHRYGSIHHSGITNTSSGEKGILIVECHWKNSVGETLMKETTKLIFSSENNTRIIDRITNLQAIGKDVHFNDSKEGMFAIRVAKELELLDDQEDFFIDQDGEVTKEKIINTFGCFRQLYE